MTLLLVLVSASFLTTVPLILVTPLLLLLALILRPLILLTLLIRAKNLFACTLHPLI